MNPEHPNILVYGPSRCGKTRFLRGVVDHVQALGPDVVTVVYTSSPDEWEHNERTTVLTEYVKADRASGRRLQVVFDDFDVPTEFSIDYATSVVVGVNSLHQYQWVDSAVFHHRVFFRSVEHGVVDVLRLRVPGFDVATYDAMTNPYQFVVYTDGDDRLVTNQVVAQ